MSLTEIKKETAGLRPEEQLELAAFLTVIRMNQTGEWSEATGMGDESDREGWVSLDEAKRRLQGKP